MEENLPIAEWKIVIEKHIEETIAKISGKWKSEKYWRQAHPPLLQALAPVYIQERYWSRLLPLVQQANDLNTTLNYHVHLVKQYPAELLAIYLPALENYGNSVSDRNGYADLVQKMRTIIKSLPEGKEKIMEVAQKLKTAYSVKPRRPAMLEELDKLLKA
ncbi:hypothetical protein BH10BAC3_BH10BAC3_14860 [soil metagenome]